ncbi:MAG TPA: aminotransferase class I/II-fold pyridoxal phosphate-dependent enzyme [Phenylobacterium sp.]|nr:aminotransferase class I/II-fold pyridoxal phosphate-dependent enzyme [Phenylobacterium sp.]
MKNLSATRSATIRDAMATINESGMQMLLLVDDEGRFLRTVTDGDLRRLLLNGAEMGGTLESLPDLDSVTAPETITPKTALELMDRHEVNHLPVVDDLGRVVRVLARREIGPPILLSTPHMGEAELHYVKEAFRTNWIAPLGPNVDAFEQEICKVVGAGHAAAVSSGTAAIHLAVRILGVKPGDRVFCSTLTFAASANPIVYEGGEPVFIDSEPGSWNMSPQALERAFDAAVAEGWLPKAVIVVNLYGQSADMDALNAICDRHGVPVIEDAAESLGARYKGRPSGVFGRMGVYSFNGNKIITTSGGGMLLSDDEDLIKQARFMASAALEDAAHGLDHTPDLFRAHVRAGWHADAALEDAVRNRFVAVGEMAAVGEDRLEVHRLPDRPGLDPVLVQAADHLGHGEAGDVGIDRQGRQPAVRMTPVRLGLPVQPLDV